MAKMITIREIAELAGVSPSTVSHALNGRENKMSPETLERVRTVLREQHYVSNMGGLLLRSGSSHIICIAVANNALGERTLGQDPFFSELIGALESRIRHAGFYTMLYAGSSPEECLRQSDTWNSDGQIIMCVSPDYGIRFARSRRPTVFIDGYFASGTPKLCNIGLDDYKGGVLAGRYLLSKGHRRIAFLSDSSDVPGVDSARFDGLRSACAQAGADISAKDRILLSRFAKDRRDYYRRNAGQLAEKYTALFFASDFYAAEAVNCFFEQGIDVPGRISVCGFDDNIFAVQCRPPLTTIRQDVAARAAAAVEKLTAMIGGGRVPAAGLRMDVSLVERGSVRDIR